MLSVSRVAPMLFQVANLLMCGIQTDSEWNYKRLLCGQSFDTEGSRFAVKWRWWGTKNSWESSWSGQRGRLCFRSDASTGPSIGHTGDEKRHQRTDGWVERQFRNKKGKHPQIERKTNPSLGKQNERKTEKPTKITSHLFIFSLSQ